MKLTEILDQERQVMAVIEQSGGEITPEMDLILTDIERHLEKKVDAYCAIMSRMELESDWLRAREVEIAERRRQIQNAHRLMKDRIKYVMSQSQKKSLQGEQYTISIQRTKPSIKVDESQLSEDFKKQTIVVEKDMQKIQEVLDLGEEIPGVVVVPGVSLKVRQATKYLQESDT